MIEQVGNALKFLAFYTETKTGRTGLTVTVDVRNQAGTLVVTGGSATEVGGGLYSYTLASGSVTTEGEFTAVFKTATTTVDQREIPALWVVGRAGIENLDAAMTSRLAPTTAGRTLDVSTGGEAGIDWANIGGPTTTVALSGTTVKTATDVEADTADIQGRLPTTLVGGRMDASVGAMAANVLTASALATDAVTEILTAIRTYVPTFRDQSALAESAITVEDCWAAAWIECSGYEAQPDTTWTKKRRTGATFQTFLLDSATTPASRDVAP